MKRLLFTALLIATQSIFAAEQLIIEPDMGRTPLLNAIQAAHASIDLVIYGLTDESFLQTLTRAEQQGKKVRILIEPKPYLSDGENNHAMTELATQKIAFRTPNPAFHLTHQKTLIIDQNQAIVMTMNLTHSAFNNERNFALVMTDPDMVKEIADVFAADWQQQPATVHQKNLVWGPNNSREKLMAFVSQATSSIKIYAQDVTDYQLKGELAKAAHRGINVQILLPPGKQGDLRLDYLKNSGVLFHFSHYNIHAKVIIIDHKQALLGSMNFSKPAIQQNRELSVISEEPQIVKALDQTFDHDWQHGTDMASAVPLIPQLPTFLHS